MNIAIGKMLVHSLWEGAVVALALAIVMAATRSARVRYAAACVAMIAILGAMTVTLVRVLPEPAVRFAVVNVKHASVASGPGSSSPLDAKPTDFISWLAPLWLAGVLCFYVRGVSGWFAARRLRVTGVCCPEAFWQTRFTGLGARLGVAPPVALLESALAEVPVVIGYLRPVVLVPVGLLTGLPAAQVDSILLHELAHIRRHDYLANLLQVFVEGMLFYHPAVWWISGVMRSERENCCDDMVVMATGSALTYASALVALEQRRENAGLALAATGGSLVNRIQRVLGRDTKRSGIAMPVIAAAVLSVGVVTALMAWQTAPVPGVKKEAPVPVMAQNAPAPQVRPAAPVRAAVVESSINERWVREDVAYIISSDERAAFLRLQSDEERAKFIEQFWERRDPTPGTPENEMKEEHYRRLAYVNEHYVADVPGWKTDRGRIYIQYGPPNEMEAHPARDGQVADEQWRYQWIDGVGSNIIIQFVDPSGKNEYRMAMDPREKDALFQR